MGAPVPRLSNLEQLQLGLSLAMWTEGAVSFQAQNPQGSLPSLLPDCSCLLWLSLSQALQEGHPENPEVKLCSAAALSPEFRHSSLFHEGTPAARSPGVWWAPGLGFLAQAVVCGSRPPHCPCSTQQPLLCATSPCLPGASPAFTLSLNVRSPFP